jgi:hypothetical protein
MKKKAKEKRISLFKKLRLYRIYSKIVNSNMDKLGNMTLRLHKDRINRLYTVINLNSDVETYGVNLTESKIKDYVSSADTMFGQIGLTEYVKVNKIEKLNETNYLIIFEFKYLNIGKFYIKSVLYSLGFISLAFILKLILL